TAKRPLEHLLDIQVETRCLKYWQTQRAFVRLAQRLRRNYPQLQLCLCLDALYACGPVLALCRENHWRYLITFKPGALPSLWLEYVALRNLCPENRKMLQIDAHTRQEFAWVSDLEYRDSSGRTHRVNAFECRETVGEQTRYFAWLTNLPVDRHTVADMANHGGRCRWKIENQGFNIQKNRGFNLEHAYSNQARQMHNWYLLLQIAHLMVQLLEHGNLITRQAKKSFGSMVNLARRLAESFRYWVIAHEALDPADARHIQIRLDSS
ncbi:MAG: hypothetical protein ACP5O7_01370, partial [Phycisphaerae bacterium]